MVTTVLLAGAQTPLELSDQRSVPFQPLPRSLTPRDDSTAHPRTSSLGQPGGQPTGRRAGVLSSQARTCALEGTSGTTRAHWCQRDPKRRPHTPRHAHHTRHGPRLPPVPRPRAAAAAALHSPPPAQAAPALPHGHGPSLRALPSRSNSGRNKKHPLKSFYQTFIHLIPPSIRFSFQSY